MAKQEPVPRTKSRSDGFPTATLRPQMSKPAHTGRARFSHEEGRQRILNAAVHVIAERGVDQTRLLDVARAAGVSIGNVQHYFPAREELLAETFEAVNDASVVDWQSMAALELDAPKRLSAMLRLAAYGRPGWQDVGWAIWVEFWALAHRNERFRDQYEIIYSKWRGALMAAVTDGISEGTFSPSDPAKDAVDRLAAVIEGLAIRTLLDPGEMSQDRVFKLLTRAAELELRCTLPTSRSRSPLGSPRVARARKSG
jgi:AcrR family transcriptional regulator